jgi:O-antigen/teichoic acid export membrane protein
VIRESLWKSAHCDVRKPRFRWQKLKNSWRYATGMLSLSLISSILLQSDKLAVSKMLSLEVFGVYLVAVALAAIPRVLAASIGTAILPQYTSLAEVGDKAKLVVVYRRSTALLSVIIIPLGITLALFSRELVFGWTGSLMIAQEAQYAASLLLIAEVVQSLMLLPYFLALAYGHLKLNVQIGIASIVVIGPLLFLLISEYGVNGAAMASLILNSTTLPVYVFLIHKSLLPGELRHWYLSTFINPLRTTIPIVIIAKFIYPDTDSRLYALGFIAMLGAIAIATCAGMNPEVRDEVSKQLNRLFRKNYGTQR